MMPLKNSDSSITSSPFGYRAQRIQVKSISEICLRYREKCDIDVSNSFKEIKDGIISLYQCERTGYKFWQPSNIAGSEEFYKEISAAWPNYYRPSRWEHSYARKYLNKCKSVLEIGCGPGHFLKSLESRVPNAQGIELNNEAIERKVTRFPIENTSIEEFTKRNACFDAVYAFQVLEHISDIYLFIHSVLKCVSPNGLLIFSVPNNDNIKLLKQLDALDMPPHHMGHFNPEICRNIASVFELAVENIHIQNSTFKMPEASFRTQRSIVYKASKLAIQGIMYFSYSLLKEPGENILMVFRKTH